MAFFKFIKKKKPSSVSNNMPTTDGEPITNGQDHQSSPEDSTHEELISITYGTGMPIDVIYAEIHHDYENEGFQDALVNTNAEYCKTKESILINKIRLLFNQVLLRYRSEIRNLDVEIANARTLFALGSAKMLEARKETCEEHVAEINGMIQKLESQTPEMMMMIESYRRGFNKGCAAKTADFLSPKTIKI